MRNIFFQKIIILLVIVVSFTFISHEETKAQTGGCNITSAEIRTSRTLGPMFYADDDRPYVYLDLVTTGCVGSTIKISLVEAGTPEEPVDGNLGLYDPCDGTDPCVNQRPVPIVAGHESLAIVLKAGEDGCDQLTGSPNCDYHIETWDSDSTAQEWYTGIPLQYNCNGYCDKNWQFIGYGTLGAPVAGDTQGSAPDEGDDGDDEETDDGDSTTVITPSSEATIIDLKLKNPLAGSVDSLPELFKKIVDIVIKIGVPLVAMAIIYSGLMFVTARGKDEQLNQAKQAFFFAIIGGLILLSAWLVADAVKDALTTINT